MTLSGLEDAAVSDARSLGGTPTDEWNGTGRPTPRTPDAVRATSATETETDEEAVPSRAYVSRAAFEAWINHS